MGSLGAIGREQNMVKVKTWLPACKVGVDGNANLKEQSSECETVGTGRETLLSVTVLSTFCRS